MGRCIAFPFGGAKGDEIRRQLMAVRGKRGGGRRSEDSEWDDAPELSPRWGASKGEVGGVDFVRHLEALGVRKALKATAHCTKYGKYEEASETL